jgi:site-specific DNA-methyltransferase (adenine-specific)
MEGPNPDKARAPRNRTITLSEAERQHYARDLTRVSQALDKQAAEDRIVNQDIFTVLDFLPADCADLLILDPPYNLTKTFGSNTFRKKSVDKYAQWFEGLLVRLLPLLKTTASVYVCSEWYSSTAIHLVLEKHLKVHNRITWEREKGRGAKRNWKNASEDIWFATVSDDYVFNVDDVKLRRKVMAPYTNADGAPKDWQDASDGQFRLTHPSNLWNDITVPFWSMPENTDHPTQKPEKLLAKLILASTNQGDFVFDPFMGVGTSIVAAKKLNRRFLGIEIDTDYCLLAAKRLHLAEQDTSIQGYRHGVFWERNTLAIQEQPQKAKRTASPHR